MEPIIIDELARMLEDRARKVGRAEGKAEGRKQGEADAREREALARLASARSLIADLADLLGLELDQGKRAQIADASLEDLDALRIALKRDRAWPTEDLSPSAAATRSDQHGLRGRAREGGQKASHPFIVILIPAAISPACAASNING